MSGSVSAEYPSLIDLQELQMTDIAHFKKKLEARLAELQERLTEIEEELDSPHSSDWEENAVEREGDEVMESLGEAGLQEIRMIQAALARIEEGEYGYCLRCGDAISEERLELIPYATLCAKCAAEVEKAAG